MAPDSEALAESAWIAIGVDDLMKYRIVEHIYRESCGGVEIADLGNALGFHELDQLTLALSTLAAAGLVVRAESSTSVWQMAGDAKLQEGLRGLLAAESASPELKADVIAGLARRSLARTRAKARGNARREAQRRQGAEQLRLFALRSAS